MATTIRGTNGDDEIVQGRRPDVVINSLGGNDQINLDLVGDLGGGNFVDAGAGNDTVLNQVEFQNTIRLGAGNDTYIGVGFEFSFSAADVVNGGNGKDTFFLTTNVSSYFGGKGNDTFHSEGHKNDFNGGAGIDTISYSFRHESSVIGDEGVTISLGENAAQTGSNSLEELISIENAIGSENSDKIGGSDIRNVLVGLGGDDDIFGLGGNDVLNGGAGNDFLFGGTGADRFVFSALQDSPASFADEVKDFSRAQGDKVDLSALGGAQGLEFIGTGNFSGDGNEVRFSGGMVLVDADGNGVAEMGIKMVGITSMVGTDFLL